MILGIVKGVNMKVFKIYYPRLDADFFLVSDKYTDLVRLCNELRGCTIDYIDDLSTLYDLEVDNDEI